MLTLDEITITFNEDTPHEKRALSNLSLHLPKGDFVTIIGSNGAGKSTLFNAVAGTYTPISGHVLVDQEEVTYVPEYRRSRYIGRLFQDPLQGTAPNMTIEENLALAYLRADQRFGIFSQINKQDREFFKSRLATLELGLEDRLDSPVGLLSGGQRQALTLLMATLVTPKVLLLDEHTAALDPATAEKVLALTQDIVKEHDITCLMITHNISTALAVGNRTIMMDKGNIALDLQGEERENMTVKTLLDTFRATTEKELDDDRILFSL